VSAIAAVQVAVKAAMAADTATGGVSDLVDTRIYNDVPDGAAYPHVVFGKARERALHTFGGASSGLGWDVTLPIFTMSRYQGDYEALTIHSRIVALLNFQPLTVSGFSKVSVEYAPGGDITGQVMVIDIDKIETRQIAGEFRIQVRQ